MTDDRDLAAAEAVIAAHMRGDYDTRLGIPAETRALLNKAGGAEPLTLGDLAQLTALGRQDLIDAAHRAGRIQTTTTQEQ